MKQLSRQILEQIVALSSGGIAVADATDPDFPIVYLNPAYESLTGYGAAEVLGRSWRVLNAGSQEEPERRELRAAMGRSESCEVTLPDIRKDGTTWLSRAQVEPLYGSHGELKYYLCAQRPVPSATRDRAGLEVGLLQRELRRAQQKIASLDRIEPVTGVLRYEYFRELAQRDLRMARRDGRCITIVLLEVDDLDIYRQTFGEKAADSCLRMVTAQVTSALRRSGDLCARAQETGIVALVHGQEIDQVRALARRIEENVRGLGLHNPRARSGRYVTVRFGFAGAVPESAADLERLIAEARADLRSETPTQQAGSLG